MLTFTTITDARDFVLNSGTLDWDWRTDDESAVTRSLLPAYLWRHGEEYCCFEALLVDFIAQVLGQDASAYDIEQCTGHHDNDDQS